MNIDERSTIFPLRYFQKLVPGNYLKSMDNLPPDECVRRIELEKYLPVYSIIRGTPTLLEKYNHLDTQQLQELLYSVMMAQVPLEYWQNNLSVRRFIIRNLKSSAKDPKEMLHFLLECNKRMRKRYEGNTPVEFTFPGNNNEAGVVRTIMMSCKLMRGVIHLMKKLGELHDDESLHFIKNPTISYVNNNDSLFSMNALDYDQSQDQFYFRYPDVEKLQLFVERAHVHLMELIKFKETSVDSKLVLLAKFYYTLIRSQLVNSGWNSVLMNIVNYFLDNWQLKQVPHDTLDYIAFCVTEPTFVKVFSMHCSGEKSILITEDSYITK